MPLSGESVMWCSFGSTFAKRFLSLPRSRLMD